MAFKRKRTYAPRRGGFKKRKFTKKRGRAQSTTSKASGYRSLGAFRAKKTSVKKYRNMLWESTLFKAHWRSIYAASQVLNTAATAYQANVSLIQALHPDGNFFFQTFGGCIPIVVGGGVPTFESELIVRGGIIGLTLANDIADAGPIKLNVMLVKTSFEYNISTVPTTAFVGWDPSSIADFAGLVGKVIMRKEVILENTSTADLTWRLPVFKCQQEPFVGGSNAYLWVVLANSPIGAVNTFTATAYFNISFSADAIT